MRISRNNLVTLLTACLLCRGMCDAANLPADYVPPALPQIPDKHFKVTDYGAAGGGVATSAIQAAINAAGAAGGGAVDLPAGEFLSGPIHLLDHIELHLDAGTTLKMLPLDQYPGGSNHPENFITAAALHDIAITGEGKIDGQGAAWWPLAKEKSARRPRMIAMSGVDKVLIDKVTLKNSPMFHIAIGGKTTNVTVRGVTIRANPSTDPVAPGHNTDACDVTGKHILIEDCDVSVGDDGYTCGGGTSDVMIINNTYGYGHGVSIGSGTAAGVSNITVDNCTFTNTECGIRIKSDRDRGGDVHDLVYKNLKMTNVNIPILIYASYMAPEKEYRDLNRLTAEIAGGYPAKPMGERTPVYHNITFSNITATAASGKRAGLIWGLPESQVTGILMQNVDITADKPFGIYCAKEVRLIDCKITTPEGLNKLSTTNAQIDFGKK